MEEIRQPSFEQILAQTRASLDAVPEVALDVMQPEESSQQRLLAGQAALERIRREQYERNQAIVASFNRNDDEEDDDDAPTCAICKEKYTQDNPAVFAPYHSIHASAEAHACHRECWTQRIQSENVRADEGGWFEYIFGDWRSYDPNASYYTSCPQCHADNPEAHNSWLTSNELTLAPPTVRRAPIEKPQKRMSICGKIAVVCLVILFITLIVLVTIYLLLRSLVVWLCPCCDDCLPSFRSPSINQAEAAEIPS